MGPISRLRRLHFAPQESVDKLPGIVVRIKMARSYELQRQCRPETQSEGLKNRPQTWERASFPPDLSDTPIQPLFPCLPLPFRNGVLPGPAASLRGTNEGREGNGK